MMKEVGVIRGIPFGVRADLEDHSALVDFLLEGGDHLHIEVSQQQLDTLFQHIADAIAQLSAGTRRPM
jgi:hypothetical protein